MEVVQCLHHLVHVWYDEPNQPDFTESIKTRIELISDKVWYLINFVDEHIFSTEEAEKLQVSLLAETLSDLIHFQHFKSTIFWDNYVPEDIVWAQPEVLKYLKKTLDWKWQKLWEVSQIEKDYYNANNGRVISLPDNVKKDIDKHEELFKKILSEDFLDILLDLVGHFAWRNIYNTEVSDNIEDNTASNQERREEIMEYAKKIIWDDRIIVSGMNNWDRDRLDMINFDIVLDMEEKIEYLSKRGIEYKLWEEEYWNAYAYVWKNNIDIVKMRHKRYKDKLLITLRDRWFEIHPEITQHILWGEYYGRCINQYRDMLLLYWLESSKIEADQSISLIRFDDKLKGIY